jgi:glycerophosphoryl diester phosphodiesterase
VTWLRAAEDYPFFDNGGRPIAMAHRGGARTGDNAGIENSMAAFAAAVALGYRYVETDVHATSDGVVVAFHDDTLDRVTDLTGSVAEVSYERVRRALIGGREAVPRLADLLTAWPEVRVNIDCKGVGAIEPLARVIEEHRAWDRVCVASFSPRRLHRLRARLGPRVATSYSPLGVASLRLLPTYPLRWLTTGHSAVAAQVPRVAGHLPIVSRRFVERAHALGKHVHVWTVDDPGQMRALLDLDVDGIITDRTDLLRQVYLERGLWHSSGEV